MSTPKKFISIALTATTALWASGALLLVPVASAQSPVDLQAQIAALLAQIQQLQAQLNAAKGAPSVSYSYTRDLTVGSKGDDVTALQQMLASGGYLKVSPTGYFGSLTKAAVAAWQAAVGLSPAAGYFGPKSRAYVASLSVAPSTTTPSVPSVPAPASGLAVKLDASNPSAGSLISSTGSAAARVPVLTVDYTAGNSGAVTLNELKFTKTGVISDSSISGAYLVESGKVLAQYNSISSGVISFSGLGLSIAAGQTRALTLAIDPSTGLTAGNTVGFSLAAASNVSSADANGSAVAASGLFPLMGSTFTVTSVSNPSIASMGVVSSSIGTSITAGTTNNIVGAWNFSVSNSKVWLKGVNFKVIGSANKSDVRNLKLYVNGTQVGSTLASVSSDGTAYFDATAAPATLNTGSNNIQVFADIMGSPSYNFQFEILNSYAVDSQYNVPIAGASNTGMQVSITSGSITVSQSGDTPTGNLAPGQSGITIAKFAFYAGGEAVKVKYLDFTLAFNTATSTLSGWVKNVSLTDDAGGQLGTTINTPGGTSSTCAIATAGWTGGTYNDCFGTIASPINYVIPANTTRVLSLKADIQSGASFSSVVGALTAETTNNLQGLTSSASARSGGASGASLTLASSQLIVACNTAVGTQTVAKPATAQKIGSYALTASSADGVTVSTLQFLTQSYGVGSYLQNLKVMVAGTQFGTTQSTVGANGTYSFSGTPFTVPKGGTIYVEVYSDILSSATATTTPAITTMTGLSGTGVTSYNSLSLASNVACQGITVAGQSGITITADSANPAAGQLVMGSTGNSLAAFRFTETSNVENVKITDMNVFDVVAATATTKAGFGNMSLYNGSTWLGTAGSAVASTATSTPAYGYIYTFHFATPVIVPQANSVSLTLKGDVSSYASSGATDNTSHAFRIAISTDSINNTSSVVVALGASSNATSTVTLTNPNGNAQTILRTKLTVSATPLGVTSGRSKTSIDDLATLNFAADAAGAVVLNSLTVTFSGSATNSSSLFFASGTSSTYYVTLYDSINGTTYNASSSIVGSGTLTYNLRGYTVSAGTSKSFTLRFNSSGGAPAGSASVSQTLSATVAAYTDVGWADSLDASAVSGLNVPASTVPINVQSVSYAIGT
jgi:hypothetical protein